MATKATIQTFGHLVKIPAFLSIGFDYTANVAMILPLLGAVIVGTFVALFTRHGDVHG